MTDVQLSGRRLTTVLTTTLVAIVLIGAGAAYAVGRIQRSGQSIAGTAHAGAGQGGSGSGPATEPSSSADGGGTGAVAPGGSDSSDSAAPSHSAEPRQPLEVSLSPSAEGSPYAQEVADLLVRYFTAINNHDYDAWLTTVTTTQAKQDRDRWQASYATTHDSDVYVSDINDTDPLTVRMQFMSHQSVELAPTALPLPCVRWDVTYKVIDEGPGLRVGNSAQPPAMAPCS